LTAESVFIRSDRSCVVSVDGKRYVGKVYLNRATGLAFIVDKKYGLKQLVEAKAESALGKRPLGRPRLFRETAKAILVMMPDRVVRGLPEKNRSMAIVRLIEEGLSKRAEEKVKLERRAS
jgi:hypothetical protein